jgi:tRNA(His) 5'-end guanylyltransferase
MKDDLGRRMKRDYEDALRLFLPRRTHVVVRIDGRAFHKFTEGLERPYCRPLADALDQAALYLCQEMIGCRFAYGQSDEYSFLLTDFEREDAALWFDGNVQKIVSVSASLFTAAFNRAVASKKLAAFDSRVMVISQRAEVERYFLWRQLDASANSLNMLASAYYPHHELDGKSTAEKHEMLHAKGLNWAKQPPDFKRGRVVKRTAGGWAVDLSIPIFNRDRSYLEALIPAAAESGLPANPLPTRSSLAISKV